jgi:hypothetical protein
MIYTVNDCKIVNFIKNESINGNLSVYENNLFGGFDIERVYYLYDIPGGESRGSHAHRNLEQFIIAASGSFSIHLDDGIDKAKFVLNRPNFALNIKPGIWRDIYDFSSGAICLVLASLKYSESDYIRNYQDFIEFKKKRNGSPD